MTTSIATTQPAVIAHHPSLDESRVKVELPVSTVTLLEDRAQVKREGTVQLAAGHNRIARWGLAPVVQDVSVRAAVVEGSARVADTRVRRALRVGHQE